MKTCENCIHNEIVETSSSSFYLCSLAFEMKERWRHNPEVECKFFKNKSHFISLDTPIFVDELNFSNAIKNPYIDKLKESEKNK